MIIITQRKIFNKGKENVLLPVTMVEAVPAPQEGQRVAKVRGFCHICHGHLIGFV